MPPKQDGRAKSKGKKNIKSEAKPRDEKNVQPARQNKRVSSHQSESTDFDDIPSNRAAHSGSSSEGKRPHRIHPMEGENENGQRRLTSRESIVSASYVRVSVPKGISGPQHIRVSPLPTVDETPQDDERQRQEKLRKELVLEIEEKQAKLIDLRERYPDANQTSGTKTGTQDLPSIIALIQQYIRFRDVTWRNALERLKSILKEKDERFCWMSLVCIVKATLIHVRNKYRDWITTVFVILNELSGDAPDNAKGDMRSSNSKIGIQVEYFIRTYLANNYGKPGDVEKHRDTIYRIISREDAKYAMNSGLWNNPDIKSFTKKAIGLCWIMTIQPLQTTLTWNEGKGDPMFPSLSHSNNKILVEAKQLDELSLEECDESESSNTVTDGSHKEPNMSEKKQSTVIKTGDDDECHIEMQNLQDKENGNHTVNVPSVNKTDWDDESSNIQKDVPETGSRRETKHENRISKEGSTHHPKEKTIQQLESELRDIQHELNNKTSRIAAEMNAKVSADESNLENIAILNRPLNIASDYQNLCSQQWLEAKQELDDNGISESQACKILCQVLLVARSEAKQAYSKMRGKIQQHIEQLVNKQIPGMPQEIEVVVGDYLRHNASTISVISLAKKVEMALRSIIETKQDYFAAMTNESDMPKFLSKKTLENLLKRNEMILYISEASRLAWKMVIQRPPMEFKNEKTRWSDKKDVLEPAWGSDPDQKGAVILYYVYPELHHADKLMSKGKVFVHKKDYIEEIPKQTADGPCGGCILL